MLHGNVGMIDPSFWLGRRVYITGHTGFKGGWLSIWLNQLGARVKGYSKEPPTIPSIYDEANVVELVESEIGDIRDRAKVIASINEFQPEVVIHMAAQPLVRFSYRSPIETYEVNVMGTAHVLEAAKACESVRSVVCITTDKCYENKEWLWAYRENDPMGGHDPYSSSKGCAELLISSYRRSFFKESGVGLASARAGNVIGGGDWASDRLIPDILRALEKGEPVVIRSPNAIRPWQHVLEPLNGYLMLAERLFNEPLDYAGAWNFGPNEDDAMPVSWILNAIIDLWPDSKWCLDPNIDQPHEANYLKLDISKAKGLLGWRPVWSLNETIPNIVRWHRSWLNGENMQIKTVEEINKFITDQENDV